MSAVEAIVYQCKLRTIATRKFLHPLYIFCSLLSRIFSSFHRVILIAHCPVEMDLTIFPLMLGLAMPAKSRKLVNGGGGGSRTRVRKS